MKRTLLAIFRTGQRCCYYPLADDQNGSPTENQQTRVQVHSRAVCRDKIRTLFFCWTWPSERERFTHSFAVHGQGPATLLRLCHLLPRVLGPIALRLVFSYQLVKEPSAVAIRMRLESSLHFYSKESNYLSFLDWTLGCNFAPVVTTACDAVFT